MTCAPRARWWLALVGALAVGQAMSARAAADDDRDAWPAAMARLCAEARGASPERLTDLARRLEREFPVEWDWLMQDQRGDLSAVLKDPGAALPGAIERVLSELGDAAVAGPLRREAGRLNAARDPAAAFALYARAAEQRRAVRLKPVFERSPKLVFTKHANLGGSHYAYTEAQSDAQSERNFRAGAALCILEMKGTRGQVRTLLEDSRGVIRDPDVSFDGRRILFAWKKSDRNDDYHLYELEVASGKVRQITRGPGVADYEGAYLGNGDIVFSSTRCVQTVDCWWTEVSNLYTCDGDGRFLRRLGFDQVHTNFPAVLPDGRVTYTRWEYNDRGQIFVQGLFEMRPDGTAQAELYGNNSYFPTTILHARGIPGTGKLVAVASGHHSYQAGKLIVIDPARGRQENSGVQLVAPVRHTPADRIDAYGQEGELFQYPYPLSETEFIVTYHPTGWEEGRSRKDRPLFKVYFMTIDGRREVLAADGRLPCNQAIPLRPRPVPPTRASTVDYRRSTGAYYVQDVHAGPGLAGVPRGTVKELRVVALDFRAAGIRSNGNGGEAGGALVSTPPAIDNGSWDVKVVLGSATVHADGSAYFEVPARTPVYFQALDARGQVVQTMRSWSTLQPGEVASCVGCHEEKNAAPPAPTAAGVGATLAMRAGAEKLRPFYGKPRGFSFAREIQPILDARCTSCHNDRSIPSSHGVFGPEPDHPALRSARVVARVAAGAHRGGAAEVSFELPPEGVAGRRLALRVGESPDDLQAVEVRLNGASASRGTYSVQLERPRTLWVSARAVARLKEGVNVLTVRRHDGDRGAPLPEVVLLDLGPMPTAGANEKVIPAFSLLGTPNPDRQAGRAWSDAYLDLTACGRINPLVNWLSAQSAPPMLKPYHAGSARSSLMKLLDDGHHGVKLTREEREKLACWIDLAVPFCGDYAKANIWTEEEREKYEHYLAKRRRLEAEERAAIEAFIRAGQGAQQVTGASPPPAASPR